MTEPFKTPWEGFNYLESFTNLEKTLNYTVRTYRLDRVEALSEFFQRPQDDFRTLHLAGSKGKGSTAIFLASALTTRGYKTGLYTSPHVTSYKERITLAGMEISDDILISEMEKIRQVVMGLNENSLPGGGDPTTFELLTILAFLVFRRLKCSWVVLETGLGGRLDATNVVNPEGVFITPIELEHTEYLGDTLEAIAGEKAGIIKKGRPVFSAPQKPEVYEVIKKRAQENECPFYYLPDYAPARSFNTTIKGEEVNIEWNDGTKTNWNLKMLGSHQGENSTLAALGLKILFQSSGGYPEELMAESFAGATLPGRMETIEHTGAPWVFDGAHTPVSVGLAVKTFRKLNGSGGIAIFGTAKGKEVAPLAQNLTGDFTTIIISRAGDFKPADPKEVFKETLKAIGGDGETRVELIEDPEEAYARALSLSDGKIPVLITGSFYMVGAVRRCLPL